MKIPLIVDCFAPINPNYYERYKENEQSKALKGGVAHFCVPYIDIPTLATTRITDNGQRRAGTYPLVIAPPSLLLEPKLLTAAAIYAKDLNLTIIAPLSHPSFKQSGISGHTAIRAGLSDEIALAEVLAISTYIAVSEHTGAKFHFPVLSSAKSLSKLVDAQKNGIAVSGGTSIGHLVFSEKDLHSLNVHMLSSPPFRSIRDQEALTEALEAGQLTTICSNHSPTDPMSKHAPIGDAFVGIEVMPYFAGLLSRLADKLSEECITKAVCTNPAKLLAIKEPSGTVDLNSSELCELIQSPLPICS